MAIRIWKWRGFLAVILTVRILHLDSLTQENNDSWSTVQDINDDRGQKHFMFKWFDRVPGLHMFAGMGSSPHSAERINKIRTWFIKRKQKQIECKLQAIHCVVIWSNKPDINENQKLGMEHVVINMSYYFDTG